MLVLSRKAGESVNIGNDIIVTVVEVRPCGRIRLGITAPKETPVHRHEVYQLIHGQNDATKAVDEIKARIGQYNAKSATSPA